MSSTKNSVLEVNTLGRENWKFWRSMEHGNTMEYVLAADVDTAHAAAVIRESVCDLLCGLSFAVLVEDHSGNGFEQKLTQHLDRYWPDCRIMSRSTSKAFVAVPENDEDQQQPLHTLMEMVAHHVGVTVRFIAFQDAVMPEVRFQNLMIGEPIADLELSYSNQNGSMLRICMNTKKMADREVWTRMASSWTIATC